MPKQPRFMKNDWTIWWNADAFGKLEAQLWKHPSRGPRSKHTGEFFGLDWGCAGTYYPEQPEFSSGCSNVNDPITRQRLILYECMSLILRDKVPLNEVKKILIDLEVWQEE